MTGLRHLGPNPYIPHPGMDSMATAIPPKNKPPKTNPTELIRGVGAAGIDLSRDLMKPLFSVLRVIFVLIILGAVIGLLITSIADIVGAITTTSTNNTTADLLRGVFGLIVAIVGLTLVVRKVLEAAR